MRPALRTLRRTAQDAKWLPEHKISSRPRSIQSRSITSTSTTIDRNDPNRNKPASSFAGYYADKMDAPLPRIQHATRTAPEPPPAPTLPLTDREKTLAKARVVFGSRLAGPEERQAELDRQSQWIAGVLVPPKPEEPDNCCMSGCVNCVWERYREELEDWAAKSGEAKLKVMARRREGTATGMMAADSRGLPSHTLISMDDDGGGSETNWTSAAPETEGFQGAEESADPLAGIPVGIREFMKTEKKLKARHRAAGEIVDTTLDKDIRASVWGAGT